MGVLGKVCCGVRRGGCGVRDARYGDAGSWGGEGQGWRERIMNGSGSEVRFVPPDVFVLNLVLIMGDSNLLGGLGTYCRAYVRIRVWSLCRMKQMNHKTIQERKIGKEQQSCTFLAE